MPKDVYNSHYEKLPNGEVRCIDSEIPFDIPDNWCWVRLSHVVQINPKNKTDDNIEAAFIPMELIDATYFSSFIFEIKKWKTIKGGFTHFADGDIAFAKITPCFQNRKSMILRNLPNGIGAGTTELKVLRPYAKTINDFYLLFFLESAYFVEQATFKGTANQQRIISGYMENKLFPLPPINEQINIAERLKELLFLADKYGDSQTALNKLNEELPKLMKQSILQESIQGRLVEQSEADEPATELLKRIQLEKQKLVAEGKLKAKDVVNSVIYKGDDNKYYEKCGNAIACIDSEVPFKIPESWQWVRISTLCKITNGFTPLRSESKYWINGTINWFTVEDIRKQGEEVNYTEQKITMEATTNDRIVRAGSTLLCCTASVGQCAITRAPVTTNQQFNALTIKDEYRSICDDDYLFLFAKTLTPLLHQLAGQTTFEFVSVKKVGNILFPLPPVEEQKRIVAKVNHALASIMSR